MQLYRFYYYFACKQRKKREKERERKNDVEVDVGCYCKREREESIYIIYLSANKIIRGKRIIIEIRRTKYRFLLFLLLSFLFDNCFRFLVYLEVIIFLLYYITKSNFVETSLLLFFTKFELIYSLNHLFNML